MAKKMIERYRRGVFGWIMLLLFWGFNALMALAVVGALSDVSGPSDPAMRDAYAAGVGLGLMLLLMFWAAGAVVFGLLAYFTRGRKEIIEIDS